jgi:DNA-binding protein YbaB
MDPLERLARLQTAGEDALRRSSAAHTAAKTAQGTDPTETVTATLDPDGHLTALHLAPTWKSRLSPDKLGAAVRTAAETAGGNRLSSWAEAYANSPSTDELSTAASPAPPTNTTNTANIAAELQRLTSDRRRTGEDISAALHELLTMAETLERGLDEISTQMSAAASRTHTGTSPDGHVRVTVTPGGEIANVEYDVRWIRESHEYNIARQTVAAAEAAYRAASRDSVEAIVDESSLGELQRLLHNPTELARRLRLSD